MRSVEVCDYIKSVISSAKDWMRLNLVEALVLQLTDAVTGGLLEQFVFELSQTSSLCQLRNNHPVQEIASATVQLESILRPFLIKSAQAGSFIGGALEPMPQASDRASGSLTSSNNEKPTTPKFPITWKIMLLTYEVEEGNSLLTDTPWIEADPNEIAALEPTTITPLRSHTPTVSTTVTNSQNSNPPFQLQFLVEKITSALPLDPNKLNT